MSGRASKVTLIDDALVVHLLDGRVVVTPLASLPSLATASVGQRYQWRITDDGDTIEWAGLGLKVQIDEILKHATESVS